MSIDEFLQEENYNLLDACFDDLPFARYLINNSFYSKNELINYKENEYGNTILHFVSY